MAAINLITWLKSLVSRGEPAIHQGYAGYCKHCGYYKGDHMRRPGSSERYCLDANGGQYSTYTQVFEDQVPPRQGRLT